MSAQPRKPAGSKRGGKFRRAQLRHAILTKAVDKLTSGRLRTRHLSQPIELRQIELRVPDWPRGLEGLRIGHLSDLHLGHLMPVHRALELVERLGAARPDVLACTGDVVDLEWKGCEPVLQAMGGMRAPLGRYLVLGNHDHLDDPGALVEAAHDSGLLVLSGGVHTRKRSDHEFRVAGIDWAAKPGQLAESVQGVMGHRPHLLLAHNPKVFPAAARARIPLTLAGHTHGGQVALRDRPRANLSLLHPHSSGLYERGSSRLFVNVGAGSWFPLRRNVPAEIVMLEVRRA
jgi:predicted MPP superfamily phosphohydrolase